MLNQLIDVTQLEDAQLDCVHRSESVQAYNLSFSSAFYRIFFVFKSYFGLGMYFSPIT